MGSAKQIIASAMPFADNLALVRISDGGGGVPDSLKSEVVKASFTTKPCGIGLGLAICGTIVDNHGGRIRVEDNH